MQLPRAILFDLDDTILAYEAVSVECWQQVCLSFAPFLGGLEADTLVASIEEVRAWYWGDLERDRRGRLDLPTARQEIVAAAFERPRHTSQGHSRPRHLPKGQGRKMPCLS